jgi:hypothetical protein
MTCRVAQTKPVLELYLLVLLEMLEAQISLPLYQPTNQISTESDCPVQKKLAETNLCAVPESSFIFSYLFAILSTYKLIW